MNRRDSLKLSLGAMAAAAAGASVPGSARAAETAKDREPFVQTCSTFADPDQANPFGVSKAAFNMISPDLEASKRLYRDCLEYDIVDEGVLARGISEAPGVGAAAGPRTL